MPFDGLIDACLYYSGYWTSFWAYTLGWSFRAAGRGNIPRTGPCLLVSNHLSHFDPWLIGLAATRPLTYLARASLFKNRLFARIITAYGAMPIDRDFGREGLESALRTIGMGKAVVMFPEGTRSPDGRMQPLKPGVALLAKRTDAPIVPCALAGSFEAWPRQRILPGCSPLPMPDLGNAIAVAYGRPWPAGYFRTMKREEILAEMDQGIRAAYTRAIQVRRGREPESHRQASSLPALGEAQPELE